MKIYKLSRRVKPQKKKKCNHRKNRDFGKDPVTPTLRNYRQL